MRPGRPPEKETTLSELAGDSALVPKKEQVRVACAALE